MAVSQQVVVVIVLSGVFISEVGILFWANARFGRPGQTLLRALAAGAGFALLMGIGNVYAQSGSSANLFGFTGTARSVLGFAMGALVGLLLGFVLVREAQVTELRAELRAVFAQPSRMFGVVACLLFLLGASMLWGVFIDRVPLKTDLPLEAAAAVMIVMFIPLALVAARLKDEQLQTVGVILCLLGLPATAFPYILELLNIKVV